MVCPRRDRLGDRKCAGAARFALSPRRQGFVDGIQENPRGAGERRQARQAEAGQQDLSSWRAASRQVRAPSDTAPLRVRRSESMSAVARTLCPWAAFFLAENTALGSNRRTCNQFRRENMLRKIALAAIVIAFAGSSALAQESCESKAMGKDGKPLAGAAKTSFMKKCMTDNCATKAVSADGKPLAGAAKNSFMKKCEASG